MVGMEMRDVRLDSVGSVALRDRVLETARRIPGVDHAAIALGMPFYDERRTAIDLPDVDSVSRTQFLSELPMTAVSPDYFATMGTGILRGRGIGRTDVAGAPGAMVVSASMARTLWPGKDALGQCVHVESVSTRCTYVVLIAEDIKASHLSGDIGRFYYLSAAQFESQYGWLLERTRGDATRQAETVRQVSQQEMPGSAYVTVMAFAKVVGNQTKSWRLGATMFVGFGLLAALLAAVGLYSAMAYNVSQRTRELGVRRALGAQGRDVVWFVVRSGFVLGALGVVTGGAVSLVLVGRVESLLFDVSGWGSGDLCARRGCDDRGHGARAFRSGVEGGRRESERSAPRRVRHGIRLLRAVRFLETLLERLWARPSSCWTGSR
jgi:putative ABC transport system permease protein